MIDKALEFGSGFDWITPLCSAVMNAIGKHTVIVAPKENYGQIVMILRKKKIKMHYTNMHGHNVYFDVKRCQVKLVRVLLKGLIYGRN